jgi:hypothetical protein
MGLVSYKKGLKMEFLEIIVLLAALAGVVLVINPWSIK